MRLLMAISQLNWNIDSYRLVSRWVSEVLLLLHLSEKTKLVRDRTLSCIIDSMNSIKYDQTHKILFFKFYQLGYLFININLNGSLDILLICPNKNRFKKQMLLSSAFSSSRSCPSNISMRCSHAVLVCPQAHSHHSFRPSQ